MRQLLFMHSRMECKRVDRSSSPREHAVGREQGVGLCHQQRCPDIGLIISQRNPSALFALAQWLFQLMFRFPCALLRQSVASCAKGSIALCSFIGSMWGLARRVVSTTSHESATRNDMQIKEPYGTTH
jgi:hypothetical protein